MSRPSRLDYAYAAGRVRALEKRLIGRPVFWEAAGAADFYSAWKTLAEAGRFSGDWAGVSSPGEVDAFLETETAGLFKELDELLPEKELVEAVRDDGSPDLGLRRSEPLGYPFITDYFRHRADLGNLKVLLRAQYAGLSRDRLEPMLLRGGFLDRAAVLAWAERPSEEFEEPLKATPYLELWRKSVEALKQRETFIVMERRIDDFLTDYLKRAVHIVFGPEPVFAYGMGRLREIRFIRFVGVGKRLGIAAEILRERIGESYA